MNEFIDNLFESMLSLGIDARIIVIIIALLPIAEARLAIPIALKCGLSPLQAFSYGFLGSSLAAPLLLIVLIPLINFLASTRFFGKLGQMLLTRMNNKATHIGGKSDLKKMLGTATFVAVPLPLTGVWTGCAIASILGIRYIKSLISIIAGNLIASIIITVISELFDEYINIIMTAFAIIASIVTVSMLIRSLRIKKSA